MLFNQMDVDHSGTIELHEMNIVGIPEGVQRVIRTEVTGGYAYDLTPAALELPDGEESIITDTTKVIHTLNSLCIEEIL